MTALSIQGTLDALSAIGHYVLSTGTEAGLSKSAAYRLRLAVDEIVTATITRSYSETGTTALVEIRTELHDQTLRLIVEDTAVPFDPTSIPRPTSFDQPLDDADDAGLGILLAIESVDALEYERVGDRNRTVFIMHVEEAPPVEPAAVGDLPSQGGLLIEIDAERRAREVAEITESDSFQEIRLRAAELRAARVMIDQQRELIDRSRIEVKRAAHALLLTERIDKDVQLGRQIQMSFMPNSLPQIAGWELAGRFRPSRKVSADWYDAFYLSNIERLGLVMADVCDKGIGAAMFMALVRSLLRAYSQLPVAWIPGGNGTGDPTASVMLRGAMEQTNNYVVKNHGETAMFATLFFGILDPATGVLHYVNGGHEPPVIAGGHGIKRRLDPTSFAVGIVEDAEFAVERTELEPGDSLLAYTDGVTDARNASNEPFTERRLLSLAGERVSGAEELLDRIMDDLEGHVGTTGQFDDISLLAVSRSASA
jgi:phosphoserine phosphatase RsbU/P